jgi:hypothetical protein
MCSTQTQTHTKQSLCIIFYAQPNLSEPKVFNNLFFSIAFSEVTLFCVHPNAKLLFFARSLRQWSKACFQFKLSKKNYLRAMRTNLRLYKMVKHFLSNPIIKVKVKQRSDQNFINSCFAYHFIWTKIWLFFKFLLILWNVVQTQHYSY